MGLGGWEFKPDIWDLDDISSEKISKKKNYFEFLSLLSKIIILAVCFSLAGINPPLGAKNIFMCRRKICAFTEFFFEM